MYEYRMEIVRNLLWHEELKVLDEYGSVGWQVVHVYEHPTANYTRYLLMRVKP